MNISKHGIAFIKTFEELRLEAYDDGGGVWTIGYGHTGPYVKKADRITAAQAEVFLRSDLTEAETAVNALVKVPLTQDQYDALVSFTFNVGADMDADSQAEGLGDSTLLKLLNAGDYVGACAEFARWHRDGGKRLKGLLRRRVREMMIWLES